MPDQKPNQACVYFLKLSSPLGNLWHMASWYVGSARDGLTLERRIKAHRCGRGSAFTRAAVERGITIEVAGVVYAGRDFEQWIKRQKCHSRTFARLDKAGRIERPTWL